MNDDTEESTDDNTEEFPLRDDTDLTNVDGETLEIIYSIARLQISRADKAISNIHSRSGILIGFLGIIFATIVSCNGDVVYHDYLFIGGIIFLLISLILAVFAWVPETYKDISPYRLYGDSIYNNPKSTKDFIADIFGSYFEINSKTIRMKNKELEFSVIFLFVGILLFIFNFVIGIMDC